MKKNWILILILTLSLFPVISSAQVPTTQAECRKRCSSVPMPAEKERHESVMKRIKMQKEKEAEPGKLKALEAEEESELERYDSAREKVCRSICADNPIG